MEVRFASWEGSFSERYASNYRTVGRIHIPECRVTVEVGGTLYRDTLAIISRIQHSYHHALTKHLYGLVGNEAVEIFPGWKNDDYRTKNTLNFPAVIDNLPPIVGWFSGQTQRARVAPSVTGTFFCSACNRQFQREFQIGGPMVCGYR